MTSPVRRCVPGSAGGASTPEVQEIEVSVPGGPRDEFAFDAELDGLRAGPPPWVGVGGMALLAPGRSGSFTLPDESGDYVLVCLVPDIAGDHKPHVSHGMIATTAVE